MPEPALVRRIRENTRDHRRGFIRPRDTVRAGWREPRVGTFAAHLVIVHDGACACGRCG